MGAQNPPDMDDVGIKATLDSRPVNRVYVDGFFTDKTDVTNAEFEKVCEGSRICNRRRVQGLGPRTTQTRRGEPNSGLGCLCSADHPVPFNNHFQRWTYVPGANWRHPLGPESCIAGKGNYPVVHIAYKDALAYAKWAGKRIPTEAEWEFAARGGLTGKPYIWGDRFRPDGKWMANTHEGHFPDKDTDGDGYAV